MQIVAILDVNDKFFDESGAKYTLDEMVNKFVGYYDRPKRDLETVIVTKNTFYGTFGIKTHTFDFNKKEF